MRSLLTVAVVLSTVVAAEASAHALGPVDVEAGLKVGAGTNGLGFGIGGRGGLDFSHLYVGLSVVHYDAQYDTSLLLVGAELGYTIDVRRRLRIRPQIGIGNMNTSGLVQVTPTAFNDRSDNAFYMEPGVTFVAPYHVFFVGADANALVISHRDRSGAFTAHFQAGFTF